MLQASRTNNSQASLWKGFSHQAQRAELLRQVIFRLKPADAEKDRIVRAEKRFHLRRQHRVRWNPHWRIGKNQTQPLLRNPAASIEIDNFLVNADQPVKSPKHKTSKCSRVCPAALGRAMIASVLKGKYRGFTRHRAAYQPERQQPVTQISPDMKMSNVIRKSKKEPNHLGSRARIIDLLGIGPAMPGKINDPIRNSLLLQITA